MPSMNQCSDAQRMSAPKKVSPFARLNGFSEDHTERFYKDNSLESEARSAAYAKSKQDKLELRRLAQEQKLQQLQNQFEQDKQKLYLQKKRLHDRMVRRKQFVCAARIQYTWRCYRYRKHVFEQENEAAHVLQSCIIRHVYQKWSFARQKAMQIQKNWRAKLVYQKLDKAARVIQGGYRRYMNRCLALRQRKCRIIQTMFREYQAQRRKKAAHYIQTKLRLRRQRQKIKRLSNLYHHVQHTKKLNQAATLIQRIVGKHVVAKHLRSYRYLPPPFKFLSYSYQPITEPVFQGKFNEHKKAIRQHAKLVQEIANCKEALECNTKKVSVYQRQQVDEAEKLKRAEQIELQKDDAQGKRLSKLYQKIEDEARCAIRKSISEGLETHRRQSLKENRLNLADNNASIVKFSGTTSSLLTLCQSMIKKELST